MLLALLGSGMAGTVPPRAALAFDLAAREYKLGLDPAALAAAAGDLGDPPRDAAEAGRRAAGVAAAVQARLAAAPPALPVLADPAPAGVGPGAIDLRPGGTRQVRFFDTADCGLWQAGLLLRLRARPDGSRPQFTLKLRDPDILRVAAAPLALWDGGRSRLEDELHLTAGDGAPRSDFSRLLSADGPPPASLGELGARVQGLSLVLAAPPRGGDTPLLLGSAIREHVFAAAPFSVFEGEAGRLELSLWYDAVTGRLRAADLSFRLGAPMPYAATLRALQLLRGLRSAMGSLAGTGAEKSLAALPGRCGDRG